MIQDLETTVLVEGLEFPEGPRWHDGKLWLSDMYAGRVVTVTTAGDVEEQVRVAGRPSGLGFLPDGRLLVVSMQERQLLRLDPDGLTPLSDLTGLSEGDLNDMVVDAQGRAYIGNIGAALPNGRRAKTHLILVTPEGDARSVGDEVIFPNGTVITPDGCTLIVAESLAGRLSAFDVESDGSLGRKRVFAKLPKCKLPDGIALDAESAIWLASFTSDEFLRVREGGEITHRVALPKRRAVACALGGVDRRTLYMLTTDADLAELTQGQSRGFVEQVKVDVPGVGIP